MEKIKDTAFIETLLPLLVIIFIIGVGVVFLYQYFQKNLFSEKLKQETLKNIHQNELLRSNIEAQEEERKRIAQDLHDELGAVLSIMRMNILMLEQQHEKPMEDVIAGLQNIRHLSEAALANVRNISHQLLPPQLEAFGLVRTLETIAGQINDTGNICIELDLPASLTNLSRAINLALYRVIMELINNTIKHSGATVVHIHIYLHGQYVVCRYSDNGRGLPDEYVHRGLGYKNIEGRIKALDGIFARGNRDKGGFYADIEIPVGAVQQAV